MVIKSNPLRDRVFRRLKPDSILSIEARLTYLFLYIGKYRLSEKAMKNANNIIDELNTMRNNLKLELYYKNKQL